MSTIPQKVSYLRRHPAFAHDPYGTLVRLALWRGQCALGHGVIIDLPAYGIRVGLPPRWRGIPKLAYVFRDRTDSDLAPLIALLRPGMSVIDVGANIGIHTLAMAAAVGPDGRVYAFEPGGESYGALVDNIELNGFSTVIPQRIALGREDGEMTLLDHPDASRRSLAARGTGERVQVKRLDDAIPSDASPISLLKIDTEGADGLVLEGAARILAKDRPVVIYEHNPQAARRLDLAGLAERVLQCHGYVLTQDGEPVETLGSAITNVVALPPG